MAPGGVDALLFDLGGVVIRIDFNRAIARWAALGGCDEALLRQRFSHDLPYQRHERGEIGAEDYFAALRASLGVDLEDPQLIDGWNAIFIEEMPGIAGLLGRAAKRLPLYAFTNTNPVHESCWARNFAGVLGHFARIFTSSAIGLRKPDAAAFAFVVSEIGVPAERVLFFDDARENVEGARASGLQAVQVTSDTTVAQTLAAMGI